MTETARTSNMRLRTIDEVAAIFRVSRRTMQGFLREHPHYRILGRRKLFTDAHIAALTEALACPSRSLAAPAPPSGTFAAPSEAAVFSRLQALTEKTSPTRSASSGKRTSSSVVSLATARS